MTDSTPPSRAKLGIKANSGQPPKDAGRKAVRPAGRKQAAGFKPKGEAPKRPDNRGGDRPQRSSDDKPRRPYGDRPQGGRPQRSYEDRPRRDFGDRPPRNFSDRPQGDRPQRNFEDRPRRDFGDRPPRNFSDRPQGDRPQRSFEDRPRRDFGDRPPRNFSDRPQGDRPQRSFEDRPRRDFGDRPPRNFSDRPQGDRPQRNFEDRPRRDFGDRPQRNFSDRPQGDRPQRSFEDRPRRDFGDRPPRNFSDRPPRNFSDRPPRNFSDRPPRNFSDRPPRNFSDRPQGDRPQRSFEDRPRRDFGDRPPRNFSDRPQGDRPPRSFEDRPRRDFGDRPPRNFSDRPQGDRPQRSFEDRPRRDFSDRPERPSFRPEPGAAIKTDFPAADTTALNLFLPCPAGVQDYLAEEVARITGGAAQDLRTSRGGVALQGNWETVQRLNLHSRLAQRVLIELAHAPYRQEADLYETAFALPWETWFGVAQTFKIDLTAQASPLQSLNFAALKIKDAVADRFRQHTGARPNVETHYPDVRLHAHLTRDMLTLYIDSSGEPLFKRGWRQDTGDAPLKETLAAAILAASGWTPEQPLYDPCCGSGTIAIEAAQIAAGIAAGSQRSFGFERLKPFVRADWLAIKEEATQAASAAQNAKNASKITIFGSDVAHRMVDFAQRNAERAGVADWLEFRGGDALQRQAPIDLPGLIVLNPPYGERIETGGFAASDLDFFVQLAAHWKQGFGGWTAWVLSPDFKLPGHMHLAENRKIPMWNGPIECRLFRFEVQAAGSANAAAESQG